MKVCFNFVAVLALLAYQAASCEAQTVRNVTVQLPTFRVTGVSTTVVVPDRGRLHLGGVNRSSLGRRQFGSAPGLRAPGLRNRATGRAVAVGGLAIEATVIDHDRIDRALLAEAARRRGDKVDIYGRPVADAPQVSRDVVGRRWASGIGSRDASTSARPSP